MATCAGYVSGPGDPPQHCGRPVVTVLLDSGVSYPVCQVHLDHVRACRRVADEVAAKMTRNITGRALRPPDFEEVPCLSKTGHAWLDVTVPGTTGREFLCSHCPAHRVESA